MSRNEDKKYRMKNRSTTLTLKGCTKLINSDVS